LQYHLPNYFEFPAEILDRTIPPQAGWPVSAQRYAGAVALMDRDVGRLTAALELLGVRQRTAVFFTALAGPDLRHAEALQFLGSTAPFTAMPHGLGEGNLRVPLLTSFPASFRQGIQASIPSVMWDLYPTFANVTWANQKPSTLDGVSLVPAAQGGQNSVDRLIVWQFDGGQAARLGTWKAIRPAGTQDVALFDLSVDPGETRDVSAQHPDVIRRLTVPVQVP
jgi:arylsulfatase A-like enzyme